MLKRNKFKRKIKLLKKSIKQFCVTHKKLTLVVILLLFWFVVAKVAFIHYVDNPQNQVANIFFDKQVLSNPNFSWLVSYTQQVLSGKNTVKNKFLGYSSEISKIKLAYPFVKDIKIQALSRNSVQVNYSFTPPLFYFVGSGISFWVYTENKIIPFKTDFLTGNLANADKVFLPSYMLDKTDLKLIFWKTPLDKFLTYEKKLSRYFSGSRIYFLPGAEYFKVFYKSKAYLISTDKALSKQLDQLHIIKVQLPDKFKKAQELDLGSLQNEIFLKF